MKTYKLKTVGLPEHGLALVVLRKDGGAEAEPDAFGCYIGPSVPIEVDEGVSWRDALAHEMAKVAALEDVLASLGYEAHFCASTYEVAAFDDVQSLTVNGQPWDLDGQR